MDLEIYKRGIKIKLRDRNNYNRVGGRRGIITELTKDSRKRLSWAYTQGDWKSMLTLTYHNDFPEQKESKQHLTRFLERLTRMGIKYLWILEFQRRGMPHYHVWMDRQYRDCPDWDDQANGSWLPGSWRSLMSIWLRVSGQIGDEQACAFAYHQKTYVNWRVIAGVDYASKYASKVQQKGLPPGLVTYGKWWGCSRGAIIADYVFSLETEECTENKAEFIRFRRNVSRCLKHWMKSKKKRMPVQKHSYSGCVAILKETRVNSIKNLYQYHSCYCVDDSQVYLDKSRLFRETSMPKNTNPIYVSIMPPLEDELIKWYDKFRKYEIGYATTPIGAVYGAYYRLARVLADFQKIQSYNYEQVLRIWCSISSMQQKGHVIQKF